MVQTNMIMATHAYLLYYRFAYMKSSCQSCLLCHSGDDIMCRKRKMFPEGTNNGYAYAAVCDGRYGMSQKKKLHRLIIAALDLYTKFLNRLKPSMLVLSCVLVPLCFLPCMVPIFHQQHVLPFLVLVVLVKHLI